MNAYRRHRLPRLYRVMGMNLTAREIAMAAVQALALIVCAALLYAAVMVLASL